MRALMHPLVAYRLFLARLQIAACHATVCIRIVTSQGQQFSYYFMQVIYHMLTYKDRQLSEETITKQECLPKVFEYMKNAASSILVHYIP